jgi:hypothetical protein
MFIYNELVKAMKASEKYFTTLRLELTAAQFEIKKRFGDKHKKFDASQDSHHTIVLNNFDETYMLIYNSFLEVSQEFKSGISEVTKLIEEEAKSFRASTKEEIITMEEEVSKKFVGIQGNFSLLFNRLDNLNEKNVFWSRSLNEKLRKDALFA